MIDIEEKLWGHTAEGTAVKLFTLRNPNGVLFKITTYGAIITELHAPDRHGRAANIVLGFDNLEQYLKGHPSFGATIGRVANRIARAEFTLEGRVCKLAANNGRNHLHGGWKGFDKRVWNATPVRISEDEAGVRFTYRSPDGEEGYPGNLEVTATYGLTSANELTVDFTAVTDQATPLNLTNHSYFNLAGSGDVLDHELEIAAERYTPSDAELIPTGEIAPVKGTPLDFAAPAKIGARIQQLKPNPGGYDHNYVLDGAAGEMRFAARAYEPKSGRVLEVLTTEPGLQLYTGNFLDGTLTGVGGIVYHQHSGFCLETQHYPDSVHHPHFPNTILRPGQTFRSSTVFRFAAR